LKNPCFQIRQSEPISYVAVAMLSSSRSIRDAPAQTMTPAEMKMDNLAGWPPAAKLAIGNLAVTSPCGWAAPLLPF
jgi:hypothetical protein